MQVLDGRPIAVSGSRDGSLRVWNIETGTNLHLLSGHEHSVRCIEVSGNRVVSGSYDTTCRVRPSRLLLWSGAETFARSYGMWILESASRFSEGTSTRSTPWRSTAVASPPGAWTQPSEFGHRTRG